MSGSSTGSPSSSTGWIEPLRASWMRPVACSTAARRPTRSMSDLAGAASTAMVSPRPGTGSEGELFLPPRELGALACTAGADVPGVAARLCHMRADGFQPGHRHLTRYSRQSRSSSTTRACRHGSATVASRSRPCAAACSRSSAARYA
jgi:hypothetical protein